MFRKSIILLLILLVIWSSLSFAFEPNEQQHSELTELKGQLNTLIHDDHLALRNLYQAARDLQTHFSDEKTAYYLEHLRDFLLTKIEDRKSRMKFESQEQKKSFLTTYQGSGLQFALPFSENCSGRYQTLDSMSFAYDFPTPLTLAVRYRESTCGFYLPKNGDGPFQVVNKDYGHGPITRPIFEETIKDFLEFSKRKIDRYNSKNPDTPIRLSYTNYTYQDLYKFAGLYNGLRWGTVYGDIGPAVPKYFFERTPGNFENGKKNGLFPQFLRGVERELQL